MKTDLLYFGAYCLSPANALLLKDGNTVPLPPKALAALIYLIEHRGHLVGKDELLDAVWGHRFVSQGVLKNTITTLRQALDDDPKAPIYIETVHRLGYRFIAEVKSSSEAEPRSLVHEAFPPPASTLLVGRDQALMELGHLLEKALRGEPQIVFVGGEPGIGKTTLIQTFAAQTASLAQAVQGQCVAQYGQNEPYLPLLEAVNELSRSGGEEARERLRRYAPTWLAQMPWLMIDADCERLQRETQGATKDRMLRELGEFLRAWTESHPLVLIVEDIHWSDHATLDAINYLARRRNGAHLMLLGSYRVADVVVNQHPFVSVRNELLLHGLCRDLDLETLSESDVRHYLHRRFPDREIVDKLAHAVFLRSEGLPLFFTRIVDEMANTPAAGYDERTLLALPDGLKQLVEHQLERFSGHERQWLDIAAVCGDAFSAELVAGASGDAATMVESWCESLVSARHVLRRCERHAEPGYRFIHAYYQELAYDRIIPSRKFALHKAIAIWYEANLKDKTGEKAAELAEHFERGGQPERASHYLYLAALNALHRHAAFEASELLQRGLKLMDEHLADDPEYARRKLDYLTLLPAALVATKGYAVPELEALYRRTLALAEQLADAQAQFVTLYWIWMFYCTRCELDTARNKAEQLFALADAKRDSVQLLVACYAVGTTLMFLGEQVTAEAWLRRGLEYAKDCDVIGTDLAPTFGQDPVACLWGQLAITRHMLGDSESVFEPMQHARDRAEQIGDPYTQILTIVLNFWLHANRREPERIRDQLPYFQRMAETNGFPFMLCLAQIYQGWIAATIDGDPNGIATLSQALDTLPSTGVRLGSSFYRLLLVQAYLHHSAYESGLQVIDDGLVMMHALGDRRYEAKFCLLRGELLQRQGKADHETVKAGFVKALDIAESQSARFLALRAACRLLELAKAGAEQSRAARRLQDIYAQFREGFETPDLREARVLLNRFTLVEAAAD